MISSIPANEQEPAAGKSFFQVLVRSRIDDDLIFPLANSQVAHKEVGNAVGCFLTVSRVGDVVEPKLTVFVFMAKVQLLGRVRPHPALRVGFGAKRAVENYAPKPGDKLGTEQPTYRPLELLGFAQDP